MLIQALEVEHCTNEHSEFFGKKLVKPYKRLQSEVHVKTFLKRPTVVAILMLICLLSCPDNSTLILVLCRSSVTLHQGQGHRNEHVHIILCHA